jgi:hypothetical protein
LRGRRVLLSLGNPNDGPFVKTVTIGSDVAFSLESDDRTIAEARQRTRWITYGDCRIERSRSDQPVHRDMVALSGVTYLLYQEIHGDDPDEPSAWSYHKALHRAALEGRIKNPPPAALMPNGANAARELFGDGDLTAAVNAMPVGEYDALDARFGLLADWVLIRHRIKLAPTIAAAPATCRDRQPRCRLAATPQC